ncbi:MAG: asparagine synthase (glutamine-hydrolyzing) [Candidatus Nitrospinota bacterium M3_3B_026]
MCGICGLVSLGGGPIDPARAKPMLDTLTHRGRDDAGYAFFRLGEYKQTEGSYWISMVEPEFHHLNERLAVYGGSLASEEFARTPFSLALGHRRLSIIDLSHKGHQPMHTSDRRYWIILNGEIYNYVELREALESRGHIFRSNTDTETILHLWEEKGAACLAELDGMFAFALYDRVENTLTLARDRFGVKPLYYAEAGPYFLFASEIKAILASGLAPRGIDPAALGEYFTFQNIVSDHTLFEGVRMLPPGEKITVKPGSGGGARKERYIDPLGEADENTPDPAAVAATLADSFQGAVRRQLRSDVEIGAYLSGGMDSGSIVAVCGKTMPRLLTFTAGFDLTNVDGIEQGFDERRLAERLSYLYQTEHYDVVLHAGDMPAVMDKLTWHVDDPRVGMCHQNWYAAKLASRFVKVCLSGAGGDEMFGGYPWRYRGIVRLMNEGKMPYEDAVFRFWHRLLNPEELPRLFHTDYRESLTAARERLGSVIQSLPAGNPRLGELDGVIHRTLAFEFKTFLHGLLVIEDRVSMAHNMEVRVPFLDNALAALAWRLPPSLKMDMAQIGGGKGAAEEAGGKKILRRAMTSLLPKEYVNQRKQGFSPPDGSWYRGPSVDYLKEILFDQRTLSRPWFDQRFVEQKLSEHFTGMSNHRLLIWSLLSFELLQRHFIDGGHK